MSEDCGGEPRRSYLETVIFLITNFLSQNSFSNRDRGIQPNLRAPDLSPWYWQSLADLARKLRVFAEGTGIRVDVTYFAKLIE
jgi:hypothetical protein